MKGETQRDRNFIDKLANDDRPILRKLSSGGKLDEGKNHYLKLTADFLLMIDSYPKRTRNVVSRKPKNTCQNKENVDDIEIKKVKREDSIHRAMNELESMISLNMHDKSKVVGFTLTYNDTYLEKHSRDPEQYKKVGDDFEYFIKKLRARFVKEYGKIEYIYMKELQMQNNRNVYHIHGLLVANESQKPFIINKDELLDLWTEKKGGILDVRNGETISVLHKYLTPHKNNSNNEWAIKMNIKAENLEKIPYKARIYSPSTGIIRPVCILLTIEEALEIVKDLIEFYPRYKIDYFPSSFNDGYAANEIERRIFEISQEAELRDMLIKKIVEFAKRKKKSKIIKRL